MSLLCKRSIDTTITKVFFRKMAKKVLIAYDFDHTIVDDNTDLHVKVLAPNGEIPKEIEDQFSLDGWTKYMQSIFKFLHSHGTKAKDMKTCMEDIPLTHGMKELMEFVNSSRYENIIISDSNSVFINFILESLGISDIFLNVYTNPAKFDEDGCLKIEYYHTQDWCSLSTVNLCKGHILEDHIKQRQEAGQEFSHVIYVGDGSNDFCPALRLNEKDFVCARINFRLWKKISRLKASKKESDIELISKLKARVKEWDSGFDVLELLKEIERKEASCNL